MILDAAELELQERGPDSLRLQALGKAVGVSHPAILHHFGSRTGLIEAVVERASRKLTEEVMSALATEPIELASSARLLERIFEVFSDRGRARTMAWLFMTRSSDDAPLEPGAHLAAVAKMIHRQRQERLGDATPPYEDTLFTVLLSSLAIIGNAIAGAGLRKSAELEDGENQRFINWLAQLLHEHLDSPADSA